MSTTIHVIGQTITPNQDEHAAIQKQFDLKLETRLAVKVGASRGGTAAAVPLEGADDDLVELTYNNGLREWTTVGKLRQRYAGQAGERGQGEGITITAIPPGSTDRGTAELLLEGLKLLGFDLSAELANRGVKTIIEYFESKLSPGPALYRLNQQGELADVVTGEIGLSDKPTLLLIHGTFSSTPGTFHHLFTSREWVDLWSHYEGRVVGFNHRSLSQSPVENALELISHLAAGARLHIISHSRGGLVGELLCLDAISTDDLNYFDKAEQGKGEQGKAEWAVEMARLRQLGSQLAAQKINVQRFVRVACPARGTLLAGQDFDRYLSAFLTALGYVPGLKGNPVYDFAKATILTLVKLRADPGKLPGLEAMIPESPLVAMLNRVGHSSSADLAVVAGDLEAGGSVWNTLKTWASDLFYWEDHDLVVHTKSMYGGLDRGQSGAYFLRRAPDMTHFNYFVSDDSRSQIYRWLTQKAGAKPEDFQALARVRERQRSASRAKPPADAPVVILIPGVFASHLKASSQRIWIDLENLAAGKLARLEMGKPNVKPDGIIADNFVDLIEALSTRFKAIEHDYDWRNSLQEEAKTLAQAVEKALQGNRTVYLLAHSSGGLLARALMAFARPTWDKLCANGGRLVMLGTPSHGSFALLEILSGQAALPRMLDLLDNQRNLAAICQQLRRYPGLVEQLPRERAPWAETFVATLPSKERGDFRKMLANADQVWQELDKAVDAEQMCYVAGQADVTVSGLQAAAAAPNGAKPKTTEASPLRFATATTGDGFVTAELGRLADLPTWIMAAAHGELPSRAAHFSALAELLLTGNTSRLPKETTPPMAAGAAPEWRPRLVLYPNWAEIISAVMGETAPKPPATVAPVTIKISVLHAGLEHARFPVAIGHYAGDTIVGAEAVLDSKLDDRLSQRRFMNIYSGKVGTVDVILNPQGQSQGEAQGALVIGLGEVGQITPDIVSRGITEAALRLALARLDALDSGSQTTSGDDDPLAKQRVSAAFSALLMGTRGGRALTIESAIAAIVTGAVQANRVLTERKLIDQVAVDEIEIVEIYSDLAVRAARVVTNIERYLRISRGAHEQLAPEPRLRRGEGGYAGQPSTDYDAGWWLPIQIKEAVDPITDRPTGDLQFLQLTDHARAELTLQATQRALVERLVEKTIHEASPDLDLPATLYELLLPNELKEQPLESTNLLLVLDAKSAQYPWEMLVERRLGADNFSGDPLQPLAVRTGIVRQLEKECFRSHVQPSHSKNALVIGEPRLDDPSYPPLPGAQAEAEAVATLLRAFGYEVTALIQADALEIVNALYKQDYRIIHIAGHGIYQPAHPQQSGVVLGKEIYLTAAEINQLRIVPEMVFLNCCHLGRIDGDNRELVEQRQPGQRAWNKLAAGVAEALIEIGVRAVVAAGWAVNDRAARNFAENLYRRMLSDEALQFGDAVSAARAAIYRSDRSNNTWGAYQCYGDPGLVLHSGSGKTQAASKHYVAPQEFTFALRNIQARASRTKDKGWLTRYNRDLQQMETDQLPAEWHNGEMLTTIGDTYAELGDFKKAIDRYRKALLFSSPSEIVPIRIIEQLANLEARLAVQLSLADDPERKEAEAEGWNTTALLQEAGRRLALLRDLAHTAERYALLGGYHKRRATVLRADQAACNDALKLAMDNYGEALRLKPAGEESYHGLNQITCRYLCDLDFQATSLEQTVKELDDFAEKIRSNQKSALNFWDRIARPDVALTRALVQGELPAREPALLKLYQRELAQGATARQRSTVLEQLQFIALILEARGNQAEACEVLTRLRNNLGG